MEYYPTAEKVNQFPVKGDPPLRRSYSKREMPASWLLDHQEPAAYVIKYGLLNMPVTVVYHGRTWIHCGAL